MKIEYQHTLKKSISISGTGLHTGKPCTVTLRPAKENCGIRFIRTDLGDIEIEAHIKYIHTTNRCTVLKKGSVEIHTCEHILAALVGMGVDNVRIEINNDEVPIMDGSSIEFVKKISEVGTEEQNTAREYYEVTEPIEYYDPESQARIRVVPSDHYYLTVFVDFSNFHWKSQEATLESVDKFSKEIAPCRTFCFVEELEYLAAQNLIQGGSIEQALVLGSYGEQVPDIIAKLLNPKQAVFTEEGILNTTTLRFTNEPARHKLLDLMGDLALLGRGIKGHITAYKPGHTANIDFAQQIVKRVTAKPSFLISDSYEAPIITQEILNTLPHRYPFLFLDRVLHVSKKDIIGIKTITGNEPCFIGHFPELPIFPGVLQIEALVQTCGILVFGTVENPQDYNTYFMCIDKCKFRRQVIPGDTLFMYCKLIVPIRRGVGKMEAKAYVDGQIACEATLTAMITLKNSVKK